MIGQIEVFGDLDDPLVTTELRKAAGRLLSGFCPIYERIRTAIDIEAHDVLNGDDVVTRGTLAYFKKKRA